MKPVTFGKKTPRKHFRSWEPCNRIIRRRTNDPRNELFFYCECRHALKISQLQIGLSDIIGRYRVRHQLVAEGAYEMTWSTRSVWWMSKIVYCSRGTLGTRCLNNDHASLIRRVIQSALCVGKKLFWARLAILPEYVWCSDMKASILHVFFHYLRVQPLCQASWRLHGLRIKIQSYLSSKSVLYVTM